MKAIDRSRTEHKSWRMNNTFRSVMFTEIANQRLSDFIVSVKRMIAGQYVHPVDQACALRYVERSAPHLMTRYPKLFKAYHELTREDGV